MKLNNAEKLLIVAGVVLAVTVLIRLGMRPEVNKDLPPLDPYDYRSVSLHFVHENGKIVRKMGKVVRASLVGDGGNVPLSHNVYRLRGINKGKETSGVCNITLQRDVDKKYVVTNVLLVMEGREFVIPVKGFKDRGKGFKIF